ncbi:MAG: hypothetical protein WA624_13875 [Methylocella sp.]
MIPQRFVVEYPQRCLKLLEAMEPFARQEQLVGSFSLLVASALFTIPYERLKAKHPLAAGGADSDLYDALRAVEGKKFLEADFWNGIQAHDWRFSRIMTSPETTRDWKDEKGMHPMGADAGNTIDERKTDAVLRVIRNALAHGNVIYLDKDGFETVGATVQYLAFLSRYEETEEQRKQSETYRLVATTEEGFLAFVKCWASWLNGFPPDVRLVFSNAAE